MSIEVSEVIGREHVAYAAIQGQHIEVVGDELLGLGV
jgi:hypothetical protein